MIQMFWGRWLHWSVTLIIVISKTVLWVEIFHPQITFASISKSINVITDTTLVMMTGGWGQWWQSVFNRRGVEFSMLGGIWGIWWVGMKQLFGFLKYFFKWWRWCGSRSCSCCCCGGWWRPIRGGETSKQWLVWVVRKKWTFCRSCSSHSRSSRTCIAAS